MPSRTTLAATLAVLLSPLARSQEIVGPWVIGAIPVEATVIRAQGTSAGWLNVTNTPITLEETLTTTPLGDTGIANLLPRSEFELRFAPGALINGDGAELLFLEARYDAGGLDISTALDGFQTWTRVLPSDFLPSGVERLYFYELNPGPFVADVFGATLDLGALGVPVGGSVERIRIRTTDAAFDLVGAGTLVPALGTNYCSAVPNSTGAPASIGARGSDLVAANEVVLVAESLPAHSFGHYLCSMSTDFVTGFGASQGNLCLGGSIGRFDARILDSGSAGTIALQIDLTSIPQPMGAVAVAAGETWHFQAWYRDANPTVTSNFTDGVSVAFQ